MELKVQIYNKETKRIRYVDLTDSEILEMLAGYLVINRYTDVGESIEISIDRVVVD